MITKIFKIGLEDLQQGPNLVGIKPLVLISYDQYICKIVEVECNFSFSLCFAHWIDQGEGFGISPHYSIRVKKHDNRINKPPKKKFRKESNEAE